MRATLSVLMLLGASATDFQTATAQADTRPNIIFIFSDDHAPHAIGAYGGRLAALDPTPNIDRLAAHGVLFENSFCTNAICGPSRAVILTGKHSHVNGFTANGDRFDASQPTFPKMFQAGGYETAVIGKWHLGSDPQGFDHWQVLPGQGDYYNPRFRTPDGTVQIEGHCTDIVTDLAIEWLEEQRDTGQPFLLMMQHKAPHRNWMPAPRHLSMYADVTIPEPPTLFDRWVDNASPVAAAEMSIADHLDLDFDLFVRVPARRDRSAVVAPDPSGQRNMKDMTAEQREAWDAAMAPRNEALETAALTGQALVRWKYQRYMKNYLGSVRGVDDSVGTMLAYLDRAGLADDTVVIYSSDQGFFLGDHGWYDKRWMYEESLRMPLIIKWPGVAAPGTRCPEMVQNLDYAQTLLDIAGLAHDEQMQGRSLVPLLRGERPDSWRDAIYYHYHAHPAIHNVPRHCGVRTDRYKLIHFYQSGEWELYDLERDPDEITNAYDDPWYARQIDGLERRLRELQRHYREDSDMSLVTP